VWVIDDGGYGNIDGQTMDPMANVSQWPTMWTMDMCIEEGHVIINNVCNGVVVVFPFKPARPVDEDDPIQDSLLIVVVVDICYLLLLLSLMTVIWE